MVCIMWMWIFVHIYETKRSKASILCVNTRKRKQNWKQYFNNCSRSNCSRSWLYKFVNGKPHPKTQKSVISIYFFPPLSLFLRFDRHRTHILEMDFQSGNINVKRLSIIKGSKQKHTTRNEIIESFCNILITHISASILYGVVRIIFITHFH